jgi:glycosyltransferase involved in cell wall biosynthesis
VVDNDYFAQRAIEIRNSKFETRKKYGLPENYFLASARFIQKKNLFTLLRAYADYIHRCEHENVKQWDLVLPGDGPLEGVLHSQVSRFNLQDHVLLPGFKQYDELPIYYVLADVFVHVSATEQWGLVVNEAMATGLPVLVSRRCGCAPDLVAEGKNGFTFDPGSVKSLGKLMGDISCLSKERLEEMRRENLRIIAGFMPTHFARGHNARSMLLKLRRSVASDCSHPFY